MQYEPFRPAYFERKVETIVRIHVLKSPSPFRTHVKIRFGE